MRSHEETGNDKWKTEWLMIDLGFVPWESSARFLDPSGPSNTTESWICWISCFRKYCLAVSSSRRLLGSAVPWSSLNLLREETRTSVNMLIGLWFYRLSNRMKISVRFPSPHLTVRVCVGSKSALLTSSTPAARAWSPLTSTCTLRGRSWGTNACRNSCGDLDPTGNAGLRGGGGYITVNHS